MCVALRQVEKVTVDVATEIVAQSIASAPTYRPNNYTTDGVHFAVIDPWGQKIYFHQIDENNEMEETASFDIGSERDYLVACLLQNRWMYT
jgi:hypothetical protein